MTYQSTFKRYEIKYLISNVQKKYILTLMKPFMELDQYGRTTIRNIYFDTNNYRLIRQSIEKPVYKEKLRIRSYTQATPESNVFVELKKKYQSIVYKRRLYLPEADAMQWLCNKNSPKNTYINSQISNEIDYFIEFYHNLNPTVFLSYEREAYYSIHGGDFRITFDDSILCRQNDLSLKSEIYGTPLLEDDKTLMEIKCSGGIPLWMTEILSKHQIYKTSFSKYGTAYKTIIYPQLKEAIIHA